MNDTIGWIIAVLLFVIGIGIVWILEDIKNKFDELIEIMKKAIK